MEIGWRRVRRLGAVAVLVGVGVCAGAPAPAAEAAATPAEMGRELFAQIVARNQQRARLLKQYTGTRQYELRDAKGKLSARTVVRIHYRAPDHKTFQTVSEQGSRWIRMFVFNRLVDSEKEAASGRDKRDSSITPHNYTFRLLGEQDVDGYHCYHFQATPNRRAKYLFEGEVWVDTHDLAIVRIAGHPARNPSFWITRINWVRDYRKVGDFWLPARDNTDVHVRIFGEKHLTIDYGHYLVNSPAFVSSPAAVLSPEPEAAGEAGGARGED